MSLADTQSLPVTAGASDKSKVEKRPRLGFVVAALNTGGAERHTLALRCRLSARGYDTVLLAIARATSSALADEPGAEGAVLLDARRVLTSPFAWFGAWRALRRLDADVIFAINPASAVVVGALKTLGLVRGRVVCVFHSSRLQPRERMTFRPFRWIAPHLDALAYVSDTQKALWAAQGLYSRRAVVIPNGVDLERFSAASFDRAAVRAGLGLAPGDYVVGIVAALRPEKRHQDLIAAAQQLCAAGLPVKLLIVGDGERRRSLMDQVEQMALKDHVMFVGDQADVRPFVVASDVCALCSEIETFSLAALEVLALGAPLVASDVGAMAEVVRPGVNGLLYPAGDVAQLAERLTRMADPRFREALLRSARPSVGAFGVERMIDAYEALANDLHAGG